MAMYNIPKGDTKLDEREKRRLLEAFGSAWQRGDVPALMSMMTDDCVYAASVGPEPGTTYRGRDEVTRGFTEIMEYESGGESRTGRIWFADDYAFMEWAYDERVEGKAIAIKGIDVFHFKDGKLRQKDAYRKTRA